jgi:hypothetical protein
MKKLTLMSVLEVLVVGVVLAQGRVDELVVSSSSASLSPSTINFTVPYFRGATLQELAIVDISAATPVLTATVSRVSADLHQTNQVAIVVSAGTNTFASFYTTEGPLAWAPYDRLTVSAGASNLTYRVRPRFLVYD